MHLPSHSSVTINQRERYPSWSILTLKKWQWAPKKSLWEWWFGNCIRTSLWFQAFPNCIGDLTRLVRLITLTVLQLLTRKYASLLDFSSYTDVDIPPSFLIERIVHYNAFTWLLSHASNFFRECIWQSVNPMSTSILAGSGRWHRTSLTLAFRTRIDHTLVIWWLPVLVAIFHLTQR